MQIVLVGNPNSGKTSLINKLTGSSLHVGNWPGVTVEKKEGSMLIGNKNVTIVDLPGIYSIDPDTLEQKISREYILNNKIDLLLNIIDATNLERSLYLTLLMRELGIPIIIVLNMMDEVKRAGIVINTESLSKMVGVPVVPISVYNNTGISQLSVEISRVIEGEIEFKKFCNSCSGCHKCQVGEQRYKQIDNIIRTCVIKRKSKDDNDYTKIIDKVVLNRFLSIPLFLIIMYGMFSLTFGRVVSVISDGIEYFLNITIRSGVSTILTNSHFPDWVIALVCDGIIPGIGTVLVFLPQIIVLFALMTILEDSGYMSRAAFIMDRIFSYIGLSGSSFIPLMMGFGCTVPAIMTCRILPSEKDRKLTIILLSFISCNARLPLYALFAGIFFAKNQGLIVFSIYIMGILVAMLSAIVLGKTVFREDTSVFFMEMPPYRLPKARDIFMQSMEKIRGFLVKAGTVLLVASIAIWALQSYTISGIVAKNPGDSILASLAGMLTPIFKPLGFGDWRAVTALITGVAAKEMIVTTLSVLGGQSSQVSTDSVMGLVSNIFTPLTAYVFMVFSLLYLPCLSTIVTMKREFNSLKWTVFALSYSFSVAWIVSYGIYNIGKILF